MPKGTINDEPYEVPEGYDIISNQAKRKGQLAVQLLSDLDRSPVGRHKGDAESQDPTGISQGNLLLPPGTHIGHGLSGAHRIVVPDDPNLSDADAWYVKVEPDEGEST